MKLSPYQAYHQRYPEEDNSEIHKTLAEISEETGLNTQLLNKRVRKLGLKRGRIGANGRRYYTEEEVKKILAYIKPPKKVSSAKITIIELYQSGMTGRDIAKNMKLSIKLSYDCIREYNDTGCVIVESKLNYNNE